MGSARRHHVFPTSDFHNTLETTHSKLWLHLGLHFYFHSHGHLITNQLPVGVNWTDENCIIVMVIAIKLYFSTECVLLNTIWMISLQSCELWTVENCIIATVIAIELSAPSTSCGDCLHCLTPDRWDGCLLTIFQMMMYKQAIGKALEM